MINNRRAVSNYQTVQRNRTSKINSGIIKSDINPFPDSLIAGAVSLVAYLTCYLYEVGKCFYYGIPISFIQVTLSEVVLTGAVIYMFTIFTLFLISSIWKQIGRFKEVRIHDQTLSFIVVMFIYVTSIYIKLLFTKIPYSLSVLISLVIGVIFQILIVKTSRRRIEKNLSRGMTLEELEAKRKNLLLSLFTSFLYERKIVGLGFSAVTLPVLAFITGYFFSSINTTQLLVKNEDRVVVLLNYEDKMVVGKYDQNNYLMGEFFVIDPTDSKFIYQLKEIGVLHNQHRLNLYKETKLMLNKKKPPQHRASEGKPIMKK